MSITYNYFLCNSEIKSTEEAAVPLSRVEYSYGFGVYENIRVSKGIIHFAKEHCSRLMESAKLIGLDHNFDVERLQRDLKDLVERNQAENCNIKILLIGGPTAEAATLYALCLNPLYPYRKLYKSGAHAVTVKQERFMPHAKTLNMLPSYLAYRQAKESSAYDALLINRNGCITEGTRTNFFALKDKTIFSPAESEILLGVTRDHVLKTARETGFDIVEQDLPLDTISDYDITFLTSTSSKIMPLKSIDYQVWLDIPPALKELMSAFDNFLINN